MMVHGLVSSVLIYSLRRQPDADSPLLLGVLLLLAFTDVVAALAIWFWQRWGLFLYVAAVVASIVIGLVIFRTQLWVFHEVIPLAILGYLLKDKWADFGMGAG
jgi:hypothetical protein